MKIRDLLEGRKKSHAKMPRSYRTASNTPIVTDMDQCYEYYRFLISVAGFPEKTNTPLVGPLEDGPYIVPFSEIEKEHCLDVLDKMGKSFEYIDRTNSHEMNKINTISPVRQFRDYE